MAYDIELLQQQIQENDARKEQLRKQAELAAKQKAAAQPAPKPAPQSAPKPAQQTATSTKPTPAQAAKDTKVAAPRPAGPITEFGNKFVQNMPSLNPVENIATAPMQLLNGVANSIADIPFLPKDVSDGIRGLFPAPEKLIGGVIKKAPTPVRNYLSMMAGTDAGVKAGMALPVTLAAKAAGQDAPWNRAPAIIKAAPEGELAFKITKALMPGLVMGAGSAALGLSAGVAEGVVGTGIESAVETSAEVDNVDDTFTGRKIAQWAGELADAYGHDGTKLTEDLINGKAEGSPAFSWMVGFFENMGVNFAAPRLIKAANSTVISPVSQKIAKILKRDPAEIDAELSNKAEPEYRPDAEPTEVANNFVEANPSKNKQYVNEPALVKEALRKANIAADGLTPAQYDYFTNWSAVGNTEDAQQILAETTKSLKKLQGIKLDLRLLRQESLEWWDANRELVSAADAKSINKVLQDMQRRGFVKYTKSREGTSIAGRRALFTGPDTQVQEAGFIAAHMVANDLSHQLKKQATIAVNYEDAGIDFTGVVNTLADLHDTAQLFLIPLRRGKRVWSVEGRVQQKNFLDQVYDSDINLEAGLNPYQSTKEMTSIQVDDGPNLGSFRELWDAAQNGDEEALGAVKEYVNAMAHGDTLKLLMQTTTMQKALADELRSGTKQGVRRLFFNVGMLSRVATGVASVGNSGLKLVLEPLGTALRGIGTKDASKFAYTLGQYYGGIAYLDKAFKTAWKSFQLNIPVSGMSRLSSEDMRNLGNANRELDLLWGGTQRQLQNAKDMSDAEYMGQLFTSYMSYLVQKMSLNPVLSGPTRLLMTADEGMKVISAAQTAYGLAFKKAAEDDTWDNVFNVAKYNIDGIFRDGNPLKGYRQTEAAKEAMHVANNITFQRQIPQNGNTIDNLFLGAENASRTSGIIQYFAPFVRISYNFLEQYGVSTIGAIPFAKGQVAKTVSQRVQRTMAGDFGEAAKLQLESNFALAQAIGMMGVFYAMNGLVTGTRDTNGAPRTSFIMPNGNAPNGYIAIDYSKMQPYSAMLSVPADLVNSVRNGAISRHEYEAGIQEFLASLAVAALDQTVLVGIQNFTSILDLDNLRSGTAGAIANAISGFSPAALRMVGDRFYPYEILTKEGGFNLNTARNIITKRATGGIGMPMRIDPYSGKPVYKVAGKNENYWQTVAAGFMNEFLFPGKIINANPNDPVLKKLDNLGYRFQEEVGFLQVFNVQLTTPQQNQLLKDMHDVANLHGKLEDYFNSDQYYYRYDKYKKAIQREGSVSPGGLADKLKRDIFLDLNRIHEAAKEEAATNGKLGNDPTLKQQVLENQMLSAIPTPPNAQGLYATAHQTIGKDLEELLRFKNV